MALARRSNQPMDDLLSAVLADGDAPEDFSDSSDEPMSSDEEEELDLALAGEREVPDDDGGDVPDGATDGPLSTTTARESMSQSASSERSDVRQPDAAEARGRERSPLQRTRGVSSRQTTSRRSAAVSTRTEIRTTVGRGRARTASTAASANNPQSASAQSSLKSWNNLDTAPVVPDFCPSRPAGAHFPADFNPTMEQDFFQLFFTPAMLNEIVENTNGYAAVHILSKPTYQSADGSWEHTSSGELKKLLAVMFYMGIVKLPAMKHYWSAASLFHGTWARAMIPLYTRFRALLTFLDIADYAKEDPDKLRRIRKFYDHFRNRCQALFQPHKNVSIDERMVKSKARFSFKQYIKNKPVKFGFKVFALCDSATSYLVNFKIYTGRDNAQQSETGLASSVVKELISPYTNQGYHLFTDNIYSSPTLFIDLRDNHKTYAVGTCQINRKGFSEKLKDAKQYQKKAKRNEM